MAISKDTRDPKIDEYNYSKDKYHHLQKKELRLVDKDKDDIWSSANIDKDHIYKSIDTYDKQIFSTDRSAYKEGLNQIAKLYESGYMEIWGKDAHHNTTTNFIIPFNSVEEIYMLNASIVGDFINNKNYGILQGYWTTLSSLTENSIVFADCTCDVRHDHTNGLKALNSNQPIHFYVYGLINKDWFTQHKNEYFPNEE